MSTTGPSPSITAAVVVLYHPEGDLCGRLQRLKGQVSLLIVIANDGGDENRLAGLRQNHMNFHYVAQRENVGLAAALNQGLRRAVENGAQWCLLLDQDTLIDSDLVSGLAGVLAECPFRAQVGLLAPNYRSPGGGRLAYRANVAWQTVATAVTSGSLVRLAAYEQVGGMCEAFFIECVDIEFALRLRAAGWLVIASGRPLMTHGAGSAEERCFFGRTVLVGHHPPPRWFLQFRNLTWTLRHYCFSDFRWACGTMLAMLKRIMLLLFYEHERRAKLRALVQGVMAGFARKLDNRGLPYKRKG